MKLKLNLIGISGVAGSGKDTFASLIGCKLKKLDAKVKFLSFAERLKREVKDVSLKLYNIDPTDCSREEKTLIRPLLLAHGAIMRDKTKGRYWIDSIKNKVDPKKINIITDVRFSEYSCDEVFWIKKEMKGILIHVSRFFEEDSQRIYIPPANEYEKRNDKALKSKADYSFAWPTDETKQNKYSNDFIKWLFKNHVER